MPSSSPDGDTANRGFRVGTLVDHFILVAERLDLGSQTGYRKGGRDRAYKPVELKAPNGGKGLSMHRGVVRFFKGQ